jgi:hypothetical protein
LGDPGLYLNIEMFAACDLRTTDELENRQTLFVPMDRQVVGQPFVDRVEQDSSSDMADPTRQGIVGNAIMLSVR